MLPLLLHNEERPKHGCFWDMEYNKIYLLDIIIVLCNWILITLYFFWLCLVMLLGLLTSVSL